MRSGQKRKPGHDPSDELDSLERATKGNEISVVSQMSREDMEDGAGSGKNNNGGQVIRPADNVEMFADVDGDQDDFLRTSVGLESAPVIKDDTVAPNGTISTPPIENREASIQTADEGLVMIVAESQNCKSSPPTTHDKTSQPSNGMNCHPHRMPNITKDPLCDNPETSMEYSVLLDSWTTLGPELPQPPVEQKSPSFDSLIQNCNPFVPPDPVRFSIPLPVTPRQYRDPRNAIAQTVENLYIQSPNERFKVFYMYPVREGPNVRYVSGPPARKTHIWKYQQRDADARDAAAARVLLSNGANSVTSSAPQHLQMTLMEYLSKKAVPPSFPSMRSEGYQRQDLWSNATPAVPFRSWNNIDAMRDELAVMEQTSSEEASELSTDDLGDMFTEQSALEEGFLDDEPEDSDDDERATVPPRWARQGGKR
jgi:hypothetical protein